MGLSNEQAWIKDRLVVAFFEVFDEGENTLTGIGVISGPPFDVDVSRIDTIESLSPKQKEVVDEVMSALFREGRLLSEERKWRQCPMSEDGKWVDPADCCGYCSV